MGQDCTAYSAWMGHCNLWEMFTGDVIVGIVSAILTTVGLGVAIWQIRKQEKLTRDQLKKQEELNSQQIDAMMEATRQQIEASMESTRQQLEEMRKAQEPAVDVFLKHERDKIIIEILNVKDVPICVISGQLFVTWYNNDNYRFRSVVVPRNSEAQILNLGESYHQEINRKFFTDLFNGKTLTELNDGFQKGFNPQSELRRDNLREVEMTYEVDFWHFRVEVKFFIYKEPGADAFEMMIESYVNKMLRERSKHEINHWLQD